MIPDWVEQAFKDANIEIKTFEGLGKNYLDSGADYVHILGGDRHVNLDGTFELQTLKAIVWWMEDQIKEKALQELTDQAQELDMGY